MNSRRFYTLVLHLFLYFQIVNCNSTMYKWLFSNLEKFASLHYLKKKYIELFQNFKLNLEKQIINERASLIGGRIIMFSLKNDRPSSLDPKICLLNLIKFFYNMKTCLNIFEQKSQTDWLRNILFFSRNLVLGFCFALDKECILLRERKKYWSVNWFWKK